MFDGQFQVLIQRLLFKRHKFSELQFHRYFELFFVFFKFCHYVQFLEQFEFPKLQLFEFFFQQQFLE